MTDAIWANSAARFYAGALDRSDYGAAVAHAMVGAAPESLLDIGAGAGHSVAPWLPHVSRWTAIEPNRYLRARLGRLPHAVTAMNARWEALPTLPHHAWAWAANIGATQTHPRELLHCMRGLARERVVWLVPAQVGPRRWCLSGALPASLHGEDERPAVESILAALDDPPQRVLTAPWTFRARFDGLAGAVDHCAALIGASQRDAIAQHLTATAVALPCGGVELVAPKLSAILIWDLA